MRVSLFVTCLVDQFHPEVGRAVMTLFDRLGVAYDVPRDQTCCGQPAFNSGCPEEAAGVAAQFLRAFRGAELIVAPSGSCAEMVRSYVPSLFAAGSGRQQEALRLAGRVYELSAFLVQVL